jgi:hypothetical protein
MKNPFFLPFPITQILCLAHPGNSQKFDKKRGSEKWMIYLHKK